MSTAKLVNHLVLLCLALLGWAVVVQPLTALAFSAAAEFSSDRNPNASWSYGWSYGVGSTFTLDASNSQNYAGLQLSGWINGSDPSGLPYILHNGTAGDISIQFTTYAPGQLAEQPGSSNEVSIVRWTAPFSGTCTVAAAFACLSSVAISDGGSVDVHVLHNGVSIFDDDAVNKETPASFSGQQTVITGDTIDFVVGNGGNGPNEDTTGLSATISPIVVGNADLGVSVVTPGTTRTDSNIVYSVIVTNVGPDSGIEVTVTNSLPLQVTFVSCDAGTNGFCEADANGHVVGTFPVLSAGQTATMTVTGTVLCSTVNGAALTNTATVSSLTDDPVDSNNQASAVATNSNPLRKPFCSNTLVYTESFADHVACSGGGGGFSCEEFMGDTIKLTVTMSLAGVDITQFNQNTSFDLTVGGFSISHDLGDDTHYKTNETQATFSDRLSNGDFGWVGNLSTRLKWTTTELTATIALKDSDTLDSGLDPILAGSYDGHASGLINDTVAASVDLGAASTSFDQVPSQGSVLTGTVIGRDGMTYTISIIKLKGAGAH